MKTQLQPVATAPWNHTQLVAIGLIAVLAKSEMSATGCSPVASKKGQKTRLDWTLKH